MDGPRWAGPMGRAVPPVGGRVAQIRPGPIFVPGPGRAEKSMGLAGPPDLDSEPPAFRCNVKLPDKCHAFVLRPSRPLR